MKTRHEVKFDMLRGVSALAVLVAHVAETFIERLIGTQSSVFQFTATAARHAVLIFFLLSGYLITNSIIANIARFGQMNIAEYLSARIARIYPPLVGTIIIIILIWTLIAGFDLPGHSQYGIPGDLFVVRNAFIVRPSDIPLALIMQNGMLDADGPLWSLYIEFHLYIAAMFLGMAASGVTARRIATSACVAAMLLTYWTIRDTQFVFFALVWFLGSGAALAAARHRTDLRTAVKFLQYPSLGLLAGIAFIAPDLLAVGNPDTWKTYGIQLAFCMLYVNALYCSDGFLTNAPQILTKTGGFSYSLYVIHFPILLLIYSMTQGWMGHSLIKALCVASGAIAVNILASVVFARFFEDQRRFKPIIRHLMTSIGFHGSRWAARLEGK